MLDVMKKSSQEWWDRTKNDENLLNHWLKNQFHGEITAAQRIKNFADQTEDSKNRRILDVIALQELQHSEWIRNLLKVRGIEAEILEKEERYWSKVIPDNYKNLPTEKLAAIGAHAEIMRLSRIRVIANDETSPIDIRFCFQLILKDEEWHAKAFSEMAGEENMNQAIDAHKEGLEALGLTI